MSTTGKIKTLFSDETKTEALFPRTKVNAISDSDGVGLDALMENMIYHGTAYSGQSTPINADTLEGHPASDFAPAGYGLGESGARLIAEGTDLNNLRDTGWYCVLGTAQMYTLGNLPEAFTYGMGLPLIRVESLTGGWLVQTIYRIEELAPYAVTVARRQCMGGTWYPWEYENPPMQYGVTYRTTERFNTLPVYTRAINLGQLQEGGLVHHDSDIWYNENPHFIDVRVFIEDGTFTHNISTTDENNSLALVQMWTNTNKWYLNLVAKIDLRTCRGKAIIKWVVGEFE